MKVPYFLVLAIWTSAAYGDASWTYPLPNPDFEQTLQTGDSNNWEVKEFGHSATRDFVNRVHGNASLRFDSETNPLSTTLSHALPVDFVHQYAFRFTGFVRTASLDGGASLYVVVDREDGQRYSDFMAGRVVSGDKDWTELELLIPSFPDATTARIGPLVWGNGSAWFDDLRLESIDTDADTSSEAAAYLGATLDLMEQHSIRRDIIDWRELRRATGILASGSVTTEDTYAALEVAIRLLGDYHSHFYRPDEAEALANDGVDSAALGAWMAPSGELLESNIGYVSVPAFNGVSAERTTKFADELQAVIARLDTSRICGWMVDLRGNIGGNVFPMLAGLGPLLGNGEAGGGIMADGNVIPRTYADGRSGSASVSQPPYHLLNPNPPIAVLIGNGTASSGEATALAFIGRPNTRTFGQASAGATTGNSPFFLSDGAILNLAITRMIDRNGDVYDGKIEPDARTDSEDPDVAVDGARKWLISQCE
jgi:hypothetical protein